MSKGILKIKNGNALLYNMSDQIKLIYYNKGNATRVDWYDVENESVQVQIDSGEVYIINRGAQIIKRFNK